jgi:beta-galactosidase
MKMCRFKCLVITGILLTFLAGLAFADVSSRERQLLDPGWKFHLGDEWGTGERLDKAGVSTGPANPSFQDALWRSVNLPHDWAVELPFDSSSDRSHGYKPLGPGYATNNIGWYRRTFTLGSEDRGKRLWVEFDGIFRDSLIFLNGYRVANHESGYGSFCCDITDVADFGGKNFLVVRADASQPEGWFYEGAGIYRHVWLVKTAPLAIAPDGTFVYSEFDDNLPVGAPEIHIETRLINSQNIRADARVKWEVIAPDGKTVASSQEPARLNAWGETEIKEHVRVVAPSLWSPETPSLYRLVTTIETGGAVVDRTETEFGIRTLAFDANKGFLLNGQPYVIKGTCNHQDHAGVGTALPDALQNFRISKLKEMGCNAIRTSHHAPTPELLDACDRLGMLVMDENRLLGSDAQNLADLEGQIRRDRNHPSVFVWSLANEEEVQRTSAAASVFETMQRLAHELDPTRLCTAAMNSWSSEHPDGFSTVMDVQGFNYFNNGDMDAFHRSNPGKPVIGTEEASAFYTRGVYENNATYQSAYDDNKPGYGATAEEWWRYYCDRPWASGAFVWTGFDYRGEPSPFDWPNIGSEFGILDACGFPKDIYYYYQSWWSNKPVLHLMPHWNWPGKEGQKVDVRCFSNCEEVELFLNGQSLGKKAMPKNSHLQWMVKYAPGTLSAKGYKDGKIIAEEKVETTDKPAAVQLSPDRAIIHADGEDISIITVEITDSRGRVVPVATNLVDFELNGPGKIIGVGNGDPISHEPDVCVIPPQPQMVPLKDWGIKMVPGTAGRPEIAKDFNDSAWERVNVQSDSGPLKPGESAVYRTHVSLTENELAAAKVMLNIATIDDEGWVYVNGQFVGESHDWRADPSFDISKKVNLGANNITVIVKNDEGSGGLNRGVALEFQPAPAATWKRSAFNGLAQVIVQSDGNAGEINLTARTEGLTNATLAIHAAPASELSVAP